MLRHEFMAFQEDASKNINLYTTLENERQEFMGFQEEASKNTKALYATPENERQEYEKLRCDFIDFQKNAIGNMRGLHIATLAWSMLTHYIQNIRKVSDEDKPRLGSTLEEARRTRYHSP